VPGRPLVAQMHGVGSDFGGISLVDAQTGSMTVLLEGSKRDPLSFDVLPDGTLLLGMIPALPP
jgi:hypothetical protein